MKLPNGDQAVVPLTKLSGYLLSESHSVGTSKARFFRSIGFTEVNVASLKQELSRIARLEDVQEVIATPYGSKYIVDGKLQAPSGKSISIRTIWILEEGRVEPRFVTAYPI